MTEPTEECSFEDFIQSSLFTFYIGDERTTFVAHSKAVAATSKYFKALVNGDMIESQTRSAEIKDVRPDDFARYLEYAYRRDYSVPSCTPSDQIADEFDPGETTESSNSPPSPSRSRLSLPPRLPLLPRLPPQPAENPSPELPVEDVVVEVDPWNFASVTKKVKKSKSITSPMASHALFRSSFGARNYLPRGEPNEEIVLTSTPKSNYSPHQDFTPIFLTHARMYTFADMRLIEPLKNLALDKLHRTLRSFRLYHQRVGDVIVLAQYAYTNGKDREDDGIIEDLRRLVVEYIVCELSVFKSRKEFIRLLEDGGEFVSDFWKILVENNMFSAL